MSLNAATNIATSALLTRQDQMEVITTNVSNSDSNDYHVRSATLSYDEINGVYISSVTRAYDSALEENLRDSISSYYYQSVYYDKISDVETVIGPDGESTLTDALTDFANALQDLATSPDDTTTRAEVLNTAETLASEINSEYSSLASLRDTIANDDATGSGLISTAVDEVNTLLEEIATLNDAIYNAELDSGEEALDLRDQRDALVKELSQYVEIDVDEVEDTNMYTVSLVTDSGTTTLLDGNDLDQNVNTLGYTMVDSNSDGIYDDIQITVTDATSGTTTDVTLTDDSGTIQALIDSRKYICDLMDDLYDYATAIANTINTIQANGYDLDDVAGTDLFSVATQSSDGDILSVIITDTDKIAASDTTGESGNSDNAIAMWNALNDTSTYGYNGETLLLYSDQILSDVALEVSTSESLVETAETVMEMYESSVSSLSGVSTDEEMVDMLEVERAYQAASKLITTIDEMLETVINMV